MIKVSADAPSVSVWISKRIQIWDGRQQLAVVIQKTLCGGRNTENLIESTCFYLKIRQFHVFCSKFSRVRMFCNDYHSKLVPESTQLRGFRVKLLSMTFQKIKKCIFTIITKDMQTKTICVQVFKTRNHAQMTTV